MLQTFWNRTASFGVSLLYLSIGIPLLFLAGVSSTLILAGVAVAGGALGVVHLAKFFSMKKKTGKFSSMDLFIAFLSLALALFTLLSPQSILSFLPLVLGSLLIADGMGKMPPVLDTVKAMEKPVLPGLISAVLPILLGTIALINPFAATEDLVLFFALSVIADGTADFINVLISKRKPKTPITHVA